MYFDQSDYRVRFDWGEHGLRALGPVSDVIVIVDVLSFTTAVDVAVSRGAWVFPYDRHDASTVEFAAKRQALLAGKRGGGGYSLSPSSLFGIPAGTRLVLPSPNGSRLSLIAAQHGTTLAACLRNAPAVGEYGRHRGGSVAVIASGERWTDGSLRPAWEDMVGAGAVIEHLAGDLSPEAELALAAFRHAWRNLRGLMKQCASGRELVERGFGADVDIASEFGVSGSVPELRGEGYVNVAR